MNLPQLSASSGTNELLYMGFNQDSSCFSCGTTEGFVVFNVHPFAETFRRIFVSGGIGIAEMLYRCNLLAIVGGGRNPRYPTNKVMIWDDRQNKCVGELMFKTEVVAVRLRRDRVVVVLRNKVHVHRFKDLKLLTQMATVDNPLGLVAQSTDNDMNVLAVPGTVPGQVRVDLFHINRVSTIKAHDSELAALAVSYDGTKVTTASGKGTIIRLWDTVTGLLLREFRRGTDRAEIYSLAINRANTFLACTSDKGTVHVFNIFEAPEGKAQEMHDAGAGGGAGGIGAGPANVSGLAYLQTLLPEAVVPKYFSSEWSFAQVRGIEGKAICSFVTPTAPGAVISTSGMGNSDNAVSSGYASTGEQLVVLSSEGLFTKCIVPAFTGDCPRLAVHNFMERGAGAAMPANHMPGSGGGAGSGKHAGGGGGGGSSAFVGDRSSPQASDADRLRSYVPASATAAAADGRSTGAEDVFAGMRLNNASASASAGKSPQP